jgi:hypothetical protein
MTPLLPIGTVGTTDDVALIVLTFLFFHAEDTILVFLNNPLPALRYFKV